MQCVTDLVKLRDSIASRCDLLRQLSSSFPSPLTAECKRTIAYVTMEIDNLVVIGLRQYTKSSLLKSRTAAGFRITSSANPRSTEEAAALILRSINPRGFTKAKSPQAVSERDEIPIRDPKQVEKILTDYSASNLPNVRLAVSLNAEVFSEAKIFRHFFAHRAQNTFNEVQKFSARAGFTGSLKPENLLVQGRPANGVRLLDGWIADLENFFDLAT